MGQWTEVLMCAACDGRVPFQRGDQCDDAEYRAKSLHWDKYGSQWYCPTCLRAVRTEVGPAALVQERA